MITTVLASKIYDENQLYYVEDYMRTLFKGLSVKLEKIEITPYYWIQVTLSGEDEKVALNLLEREIGLGPTHICHLKKFSSLKGYIANLTKSREEISIDIGFAHPKMLNAKIPLQCLQAQLVDGRKIALQKIAELYGFSENTPVIIKVTGLHEDVIEAELAENQLATYRKWIKTLFDRLLILGAPVQEVRKAIKYARCQNDIITVDSLGLFEHAIVCKLGTDAVGLMPKLGKKLPNAIFSIFSPRKILEFLPDTITKFAPFH